MTKKPNYELLKDAYAIIDGIPDTAVDLRAILTERGPSLECGTICCAAGWLGMHPAFQALGLGVTADGSDMTYKDNRYFGSYARQMADLFGIPESEAATLFDRRQIHEHEDDWKHLTQKQVFLRRLREYLKEKGQL